MGGGGLGVLVGWGGWWGGGLGNFHVFCFVERSAGLLVGYAADNAPAVGVKVPELFLDFEQSACVTHCGFDLHPVADDLRIRCKTLDSPFAVTNDFLRIEVIERAAIPFPFF